jgi:hypothetical protein
MNVRPRVPSTGRKLTDADAAVIKGMLLRGDPQHDIAAWFGVNPGRISDINTGKRFESVQPSVNSHLPPCGPYGGVVAA